ncbi:MAG: hypothetical protein Q7T91_08415 [Sulfuricurvum sp.]|nr:hypothetical protein [Sulfuricurvum sp.]
MKHKIFIASLVLSAVATNNLCADESVQVSLKEEKISLKTRDSIEIGLQSYWYKYEEEVNNAFFMSNTGYKYGLSATGIKTLADDYYVIADARYATGDVKYSSASGEGYVADNRYEIRLLVGNEALVENYLLASYLGVGYRRLDNDLRDLGAGGYRRTSQYLYVPIGVTHRFLVDRASRLSTNIEYDYFVQGEQKSYLSDVNVVYGDPVDKQKHGYGVRINSAYEVRDWSAGAFFNYWHIGDSEKSYDGYEPKNDTKELGIEIKYRF